MSNGKIFTFCVCQKNASRSMYVDANPHILACDNLKMENSSRVACAKRP